MDPSSEDSGRGSGGPPDRQTLRLFERQLASDPLIAETAFAPDPYEPRLLEGVFDTGQYPAPVTAARIDIRWFTTGDFSMHYLEDRENTRWECCWDRHPNSHNSRLHFHDPPTGAAVSNLELSSLHPLDVYSTVLEVIEGRLESLW